MDRVDPVAGSNARISLVQLADKPQEAAQHAQGAAQHEHRKLLCHYAQH
jgi:hypothetical protein